MAGADPEERRAFAAAGPLVAATEELSWLLGRGYAEAAAATLVGDHHQLTRLQRAAIRRSACSDAARDAREARRVDAPDGRRIAVDGFNQLVTTERALAGGVVLRGRDGALRDVAGVHGTWRRSAGTGAALARLVDALAGAADVRWVLDQPVSNSGRLAALIRARGGEVEVVDAADGRLLALAAEGFVLATSDAGLLDRGVAWIPLVARALAGTGARIVHLGRSG